LRMLFPCEFARYRLASVVVTLRRRLGRQEFFDPPGAAWVGFYFGREIHSMRTSPTAKFVRPAAHAKSSKLNGAGEVPKAGQASGKTRLFPRRKNEHRNFRSSHIHHPAN